MNEFRFRKAFESSWRAVEDLRDEGLAAQWHTSPPPAPGSAAQSTRPAAVWYFQTLAADDPFENRSIRLHIPGIHGHARAWLNGTPVGEMEGLGAEMGADITGSLRQGDNQIAVRVTPFAGYEPDGVSAVAAMQPGAPTLEFLPKHHLVDVFVQPDLRRKRIAVSVEAAGAGSVRVSIEGTSHSAEGPAGTIHVDIPDFAAWSPDTPVLYTAQVELIENGAPVDAISVRFGMREFTHKENRFFLNNRPYLVRGVWYRPNHGRAQRRDLEIAKKAGFNAIRFPKGMIPNDLLDAADELGMLVFEIAAVTLDDDVIHAETRTEAAAAAMFARDKNHPSVVVWSLLDAADVADPNVRPVAEKAIARGIATLRRLDPSRMIMPFTGAEDVTGKPTRAYRPYHEAGDDVEEIFCPLRAPVGAERRSIDQQTGSMEALSMITADGFATIEWEGGEDLSWVKARDLDRIIPEAAVLTQATREIQSEAARLHLEAIRSNPRSAAFWYSDLRDEPGRPSTGLLDRHGKPKPALQALQRILKPMAVAIYLERTNLTPRDEVNVSVVAINDDRLDLRADLSLQVIGPTNQVLWKKKRSVKLPKSGKELWSGSISASGSVGTHQFTVRVMQGMKVMAESTADFYVSPPAAKFDDLVHVIDPQRQWIPRIQPLVKEVDAKASIHIVPPISNTIRAYPEEDLARVLAEAYSGAVTIIFSPPSDWNDFATRLDAGVTATTRAAGPLLHYVKLHPVSEGLPNRTIMRQPYANVAPFRSFVEAGDEDISGCIDLSDRAQPQCGSNILVRRFGTGRLVFVNVRLLDALGPDPVANRMFVNLLQHFIRRSVPSPDLTPLPGSAMDWLRRENGQTRVWMIAGPFPNSLSRGHDTVYGPEERLDLQAAYAGSYGPVAWTRWQAIAEDGYTVNLRDACFPIPAEDVVWESASAYAYAEIHAPSRHEVDLLLKTPNATKMWVNGALVHEAVAASRETALMPEAVPYVLRQGRNTVLIKLSAQPGPFSFSLDVTTANALQLMKWWR